MRRNPIRRPWRRHAAPWLLGASFVLNVAALRIPFLDMRRFLSTEDYSLPSSIALLWDKGLIVLAIVVVAFSVVFPFVKLALMAAIVLGWIHPRRRAGVLALVERFGKWSMLDVFLVCLMIALANDQLLIGAKPRAGILCFTLAIVLSMLCSALMAARLQRRPPAPVPLARSTGVLVLGQIALLALLVAALCVPFLQIDDWLLADRPVSILGAIAGLWDTGARTLAAVVAAFLVLAPLGSAVLALVLLRSARRAPPSERLRGMLATLRHWEMLDVFALALGIFLAEGRTFVRTDLAWGAFLLALLLALYWPASIFQQRRLTA